MGVYPADTPTAARVGLREILTQWGRIGCIGFGGPPAHISLLRELCVTRRGWLSEDEFEDAIATCNLLPGPASTQLAILCAWRVAGPAGARCGGRCGGRRGGRGDTRRRRAAPGQLAALARARPLGLLRAARRGDGG